jgi:two-component system sensor histidine kinase MtrB
MSRPLLASYNGSVYWLPDDSNWKQVRPKGGSPVYPG